MRTLITLCALFCNDYYHFIIILKLDNTLIFDYFLFKKIALKILSIKYSLKSVIFTIFWHSLTCSTAFSESHQSHKTEISQWNELKMNDIYITYTRSRISTLKHNRVHELSWSQILKLFFPPHCNWILNNARFVLLSCTRISHTLALTMEVQKIQLWKSIYLICVTVSIWVCVHSAMQMAINDCS